MNKNAQNRTSQSKPGVNPKTGLTATQEQCAVMLAAGENVSAVAERLQISRTTIYQWGDLLTFQCFSNQLRDEARQIINGSLARMATEAVEAVRQVLSSDNEGMKLRAATWILERMDGFSVGECNPFKVLKEKATHTDITTEWAKGTFHAAEYADALEAWGLEEDEAGKPGNGALAGI